VGKGYGMGRGPGAASARGGKKGSVSAASKGVKPSVPKGHTAKTGGKGPPGNATS
jgi:hypothetical protein